MPAARGGKVVLGVVLLHAVCCGVPLLVAAGVFTSGRALLRLPLLIMVGAVLAVAAVVVALRRGGRTQPDACCAPSPPDTAADRHKTSAEPVSSAS